MTVIRYSAAILCGGKSRRMGEDKASLQWKDIPLAKYKWQQFTGCAEEVVVMGAHGGGEVLKSVQAAFPKAVVRDATCSGNRVFAEGAAEAVAAAFAPDTSALYVADKNSIHVFVLRRGLSV